MHKDDGFIVVTALGGATEEEVADWATQFELTHPVVQDTGFAAYMLAGQGGSSIAWPYVLLIDRGMEIVADGTTIDERDIEDLLEE